MNKRYYCWLLVPTLISFFLICPIGCSKSNEQQPEEKGRIQKMTDEAAETVEKKIRTPLDKARATQDLGDERMNDVDKALQKQ